MLFTVEMIIFHTVKNKYLCAQSCVLINTVAIISLNIISGFYVRDLYYSIYIQLCTFSIILSLATVHTGQLDHKSYSKSRLRSMNMWKNSYLTMYYYVQYISQERSLLWYNIRREMGLCCNSMLLSV